MISWTSNLLVEHGAPIVSALAVGVLLGIVIGAFLESRRRNPRSAQRGFHVKLCEIMHYCWLPRLTADDYINRMLDFYDNPPDPDYPKVWMVLFLYTTTATGIVCFFMSRTEKKKKTE